MIWVLTGPEGSGKSCVMTALAITQHNYYMRKHGVNMPIYTFPGYEITHDDGSAFSEEIKTKDWITLPDEMSNLILCIDEAQIFLNALDFARVIDRLFINLALQRRHRNLTIYMCIQDFSMLVKGMRFATHLVSYLWDDYWTQRAYGIKTERGRKILMRTIDNKGFITGRPRSTMFPDRQCLASRVWPNFRTYQITSVFAGMDKINIEREQFTIKNGQVVDSEAKELAYERLSETIGLVVDDLRGKGIPYMPRDALRELMVAQGIQCSDRELGYILKRDHEVTSKRVSSGERLYVFK